MQALTPEILVAKYQTAISPLSQSILEGMDSIDWAALEHAHGAASDVPPLLRAALSENIFESGFAFKLLHETIWHQGIVYEASAHVVPFLFKMLKSPETPDKTNVAFLLASLALGESEHNWGISTREAVGEDLGLLYPYLKDASATVRDHIAQALALYPERSNETLPLLEQALVSEEDIYSKRQIQATLATLRSGSGTWL